MAKKAINQNDYINLELLNSIGSEYIFNNLPINRLNNKTTSQISSNETKIKNLADLKDSINSIEDCKLKKNSKQIILGEGNINSPLMIIGEAPNSKDDLFGKIFSSEDGDLLQKMLLAINIKKQDVYTTYAINFRPPDDRKPTTGEIRRYSYFLKKHIEIINPKLIVSLGSTAMEALTGLNSKISSERGEWKQIIIKNTNYHVMITFDPSYLLRIPENKKYAWKDLKKIKKKIDELDLKI